MVSCKKVNDNPFSDPSGWGKGTYLVLNKSYNLNFDYSNLASSTVGINVSQYSGGEDITSIDVFVAVGASYDVAKWRKVKTIANASGGVDIKVTGSELLTALGVTPADLQPGSFYTFYNRITTKSGQVFDVNNTGNNNGSGLVTGPTYGAAFYFTAYITCPFIGPVGGSWKVVQDDWNDWVKGDLVTVVDGPGANQIDLSNVWPNPIYGSVVKKLVVDIDPATGSATVKKVNFGDYGGGYNMTAYGVAGASNFAGYVFSCTKYIKLTMEVKADGPGGNSYDNGPSTLILTQ